MSLGIAWFCVLSHALCGCACRVSWRRVCAASLAHALPVASEFSSYLQEAHLLRPCPPLLPTNAPLPLPLPSPFQVLHGAPHLPWDPSVRLHRSGSCLCGQVGEHTGLCEGSSDPPTLCGWHAKHMVGQRQLSAHACSFLCGREGRVTFHVLHASALCKRGPRCAPFTSPWIVH